MTGGQTPCRVWPHTYRIRAKRQHIMWRLRGSELSVMSQCLCKGDAPCWNSRALNLWLLNWTSLGNSLKDPLRKPPLTTPCNYLCFLLSIIAPYLFLSQCNSMHCYFACFFYFNFFYFNFPSLSSQHCMSFMRRGTLFFLIPIECQLHLDFLAESKHSTYNSQKNKIPVIRATIDMSVMEVS